MPQSNEPGRTIEGQFRRITRKKKKRAARKNLGSIGTDIYDFTHSDPYPPLTTGGVSNQSILDRFKQQFADAVAQLDDASNQLDATESALLEIAGDAQNDPQYAALWQSHYNKVIAAQSTRNSALNAIRTASDWIETAKSQFGLSGAFVIPWAAVAGITAATAAILAIVFAANSFYNGFIVNRYNMAKLQAAQDGEDFPDVQPQLLETGFQSGIGSIFAGIGSGIQWIVLGALAFFVLLPALESDG